MVHNLWSKLQLSNFYWLCQFQVPPVFTLKDKTMLNAYLEAKVMSHVISESLASKPEFIRPGFHTCFCIYPQAKPRSLTGFFYHFQLSTPPSYFNSALFSAESAFQKKEIQRVEEVYLGQNSDFCLYYVLFTSPIMRRALHRT